MVYFSCHKEYHIGEVLSMELLVIFWSCERGLLFFVFSDEAVILGAVCAGFCGAGYFTVTAGGFELDSSHATAVLFYISGSYASDTSRVALCICVSKCCWPECTFQPWSSKVCCACTCVCSLEHDIGC